MLALRATRGQDWRPNSAGCRWSWLGVSAAGARRLPPDWSSSRRCPRHQRFRCHQQFPFRRFPRRERPCRRASYRSRRRDLLSIVRSGACGSLRPVNLKAAIGLFPFGGELGIFSWMTRDLPLIAVHPTGEQSTVALGGAAAASAFGGRQFRRFGAGRMGSAMAFTPLGQLPFFIDFLKTAVCSIVRRR